PPPPLPLSSPLSLHDALPIYVHGVEELERRLAAADPSALLSINVALDEPIALERMARIREMHAGIVHCIPQYRLADDAGTEQVRDRKSTRLNSSHSQISYAVF